MTKPFKPTTLYIKTHNVTGLKYFGKTTGNPFEYRGSGIYWLAHLRKHGNDVTTEILGYYTNKDECIQAAKLFSIENNIVKAVNEDNKKIWANQIIENGTDGGATTFGPLTEEVKRKISQAQKGKVISAETKEKIKAARAKQKNVRTKGEWQFPEESKQKLRDANLGKKQSKETIEKRRARLIGHIVTEETRQKLSKSHTGKIVTEETKQKLRLVTRTEEQKAHLRNINLGKTASIETKEKLSGKVVVIDKQGKLYRIPKEQYYSQTGPKNEWEWVHHKSAEGSSRKITKCNE